MRKIGQIDLKVTNRSGFDKSHRSLFTMECGTLYPILVDELVPNSTIHLKQLMAAQFPPLATDAFANVKIKTEAFFVPYRLLYGGFEYWITETPLRSAGSSVSYTLKCPTLEVSNQDMASSGTLHDFLGFKLPSDMDFSEDEKWEVNIFPYLAYARIYDDWYRNSLIQAPLFVPRGTGVVSASNIPDTMITTAMSKKFDGTGTSSASVANNGFFADGSYITDLRQRNFGLDYFTSAQPSAQRGSARSVSMTVANNTASFTIASLRAQNSLQIFTERNNFSYRIEDYNLINYGARLHRGMATRPVYLGGQSMDVYSKTVYQTDASGAVSTSNPFDSVGAKYADARAMSEDTLVSNFTTDEAGIFMVLASIVPKVTYNTGTRRYLSHFVADGSQTDLANAVLQNVGNQPIYQYELQGGEPAQASASPAVFAYTDRFAEWMTMEDEVHGLLKDGATLDAFALQRSFGMALPVVLNSDFLKIPKNYLDQIMATNVSVSKFSAWCEAYFDYKVVQPLAEYSIPSLQDPAYEHGQTVSVNKNGGSL